MKKLSFIAMSALLVLGVASCKKNTDVQNPESKEGMVKTVFSAVSNESREKTSISGSDILWSAEDQVKIYAGTSTTGNDFTLTDGAGNTSAIFEGWISATATAPYYAVYPSKSAQGIDGSAIKYSIPAEQAYVENSFATNTVPMVAYSEADKSLAFKNQTAFIKLTLTGAGTIASMTLESASNSICGTFSVSKTDPTAASTAVTGANKITVTGISGTALDASEAINVIIALAPANFVADDLTLSMTASDGKAFSTTLGGFNIGRSQGKAIAVNVEFVTPTTGYADRNDGTGTVKVKWVQLWKDGPKWAVYNVGATSVEEYGGYYCWGSSIDKDDKYLEGYDENPLSDHDTAKNLWGDNWKMPTKEDMLYLVGGYAYEGEGEIGEEVAARTNTVYMNSDESGYGVAGLLCTGIEEGYTENSVFFPAAGFYPYGQQQYVSNSGMYWASSYPYPGLAWEEAVGSYFYKPNPSSDAKNPRRMSWGRSFMCSVRAVLNE